MTNEEQIKAGAFERWVRESRKCEVRPDVDAFLLDLLQVCHKHGLALGHEDSHGAFVVNEIDELDEDWLLDAIDARGAGK